MCLESLLQADNIIVAQQQRIRRAAPRNARAVGDAEGRGARAGGDEQAVDVSMVAAGEFDDQVASREPARQADGAH